MCVYCENNLNIFRSLNTNICVRKEQWGNFITVTNKSNYLTIYAPIRYCPMCGEKLGEQKNVR